MFYVELHIKHQMGSTQLWGVGRDAPMGAGLRLHIIATPPNRLKLGEEVRLAVPDGYGRSGFRSDRSIRLNGLAFHFQIDPRIAPGRLGTCMAEHVADGTGVGTCLEHVDGCRMAQDVRMDVFPGQVGAPIGGGPCLLHQNVPDAPARERLTPEVDEDRSGAAWIHMTLIEPGTQDCGSAGPQRNHPLLTALAPDTHVRWRVQLPVAGAEGDDFSDTRAGLPGEADECIVTAARCRRAIWCPKDGVYLLPLEVIDFGARAAFGGDTQHTLALGEHHWIARCHVLIEDVQSCQPGVACGDRVVALVLQVLEETEHGLDPEIFETEPRHRLSETLCRKHQEQLDRISVCKDRVWAHVALSDQVVMEEGAQVTSQAVTGGHGAAPPAVQRRGSHTLARSAGLPL